MTVPVTREFTATVNSNTEVIMEDTLTSENVLLLTQSNVIRDAVLQYGSSQSGARGRIFIRKNGQQTPVIFYTENMDVSNDGRLNPGPIALTPGSYQLVFKLDAPTSSITSAVWSVLLSFAQPPA